MIQAFTAFAFKGSVVDLAVGVIIGAAFGKIVSSLVDNVLMPLVGLVLGGVDLTTLGVTIGAVELKYGLFVQSILDFAIVAFVRFPIVRQANRFMAGPPPEPVVPEPSDEAKLLGEIRDLLRARG